MALAYHALLRWTARSAVAAMLLLQIGVGGSMALAAPASTDVAAFGATAHGKVGDVVKVVVGITNQGPDRFVAYGEGGLAVTWRFTPPPGTQTVPGPKNELSTIFGEGGSIGANRCSSDSEQPFGAGPYECWSTAFLKSGESSKGTFYLKITEVIPNAAGKVQHVRNKETPPDSNSDNDRAAVIINPDDRVVASVGGVSVTRMMVIGAVVLLVLVIAVGLLIRASAVRRRDGTIEWPDIRTDPRG